MNPRVWSPCAGNGRYGNLTPAMASDPNYGMSFELRMPTTTWNGDFFFTGGSGLDGVVGEAVGATLGGGTAFPPALYRGFAVITQNSGHTSDQNTGFGYDPQARSDYGYQQTGTLAPSGKIHLDVVLRHQPRLLVLSRLFQWRAGSNDIQSALG